ncbi:MAG: Gfo/Idh/MocA family oxidoreductase [Bryobacterales bacterium]|nr:Gfo/Idh/MocA family oxidoreductase [Bryobacterales bacterium]
MTKERSGAPARIVVAGAGLIGQAHIERILREPEARLAGIVDIDEKGAARASAHGVPYSAGMEAMMENARPDGIVIALPNQAHFAAGMAAVHARIAMLMEKPVCETVEQALELAEAAERAGVPVLVGHHRRHSPIIRRAKEILASGRLGRIIAVNALCWLLKPPAYFEGRNSWRREPGGGPVIINLIHAIDDLRNLCGDIVTVQAMTSNQARGFPVEDTAGVILGFHNGVIGTLTLSDAAAGPWSWELTAGENRAYPRTAESCYYITGSAGALSIPRMEFWHHGAHGHWWTPIHAERGIMPEQDLNSLEPGQDPLANQMRHFCDVARGQAQPVLDARGGARTLQATLAIHEAARTGQMVRLG